jgi:PAS domain S-box-containing protein
VTIPADVASVDSVLCTHELRQRPSRLPDYEKENRALVALAKSLSENPRKILQRLADTILEVTGAGSAGISLLTPGDGGKSFYWPAIAGSWKSYIGGGTPRDFGPCGDVLDRDTTLLFSHPERRYTYLEPVNPAVEEALLVPFYVAGKAVGTVWVISHDPHFKFDAEDERLLNSLGKFASSAFQVVSGLETDELFRQQSLTFDTILSTITDFAYIFDRSGRFRYVNRALLDLWGLKLEEAVGKNFFDLKYPDDLAGRLQGQIQQVIDTKQGLRDETPYTSPAGVIGYYEYIFQPVFDADGNVEAVAGSTREISSRKKMEEDLRDAKARLESTLYASEIGTWTFDIQKDRVVADENLARLYSASLTEQDAAGAPLKQYLAAVHPDDRDAVEAAVRAAIREPGNFFEKDYRLVQADGSIRWVTARGRVEYDQEGNPAQFPAVLIDITERKQAEDSFRKLAETLEAQVRDRTEELQSRNAEMLHQAEQLRDLSNRLQQSQDDERRRIARELHDSAGQIIVALAMNLELMAQGEDPASTSKRLEESRKLVQDLSDEIRTVSYLLHPPLLEEAGLASALAWYVEGFQQRSSGLRVKLSIAPSIGRFSPETELAIFRIAQECLTNIHRHSGADAASVELTQIADHISLKIQDNGKGMSSDKLAGIRQRSGVGITGMRERVRHLGGTMEISSDDYGTKVGVALPISDESLCAGTNSAA